MIRTFKRLRGGALAAAMLVGGAGAAALVATPAGASNKQVTAAGSFTTYQLMHALFPTSINNLLPGGKDTTPDDAVATTSSFCTNPAVITNFTLTGAAPNGSGAGKTALHHEESAAATNKGCLTIGRSSAPPENASNTKTAADLDFYAYALDGVAPMVGTNAGGTVTGTPAAFTLTQLRNIYHCITGYTTWASTTLGLPGAHAGAINRFWPQTGSGTRSVYGDILGFTPSKTTGLGSCTAVAPTEFTVGGHEVANEENTESGLVYATQVLGKTIKDDIFIYSAGKFVSQWNDLADYGMTSSDHNRITATNAHGNFTATNLEYASIRERKATAGTTVSGTPENFVKFTASGIGRTSFAAGVNTTIVTESNEWYSHVQSTDLTSKVSTTRIPGVRYVYNICDTATPGYGTCKALVGFDNQTVSASATQTTGEGTKSRLCAGSYSATITAQGFVPLTKIGHPRTPATQSNLASATCREFVGQQFPGLGSPIAWTYNTWANPTT